MGKIIYRKYFDIYMQNIHKIILDWCLECDGRWNSHALNTQQGVNLEADATNKEKEALLLEW